MTPPDPHIRQPSTDNLLVLGTTSHRARSVRFGILTEDRLRHVYVLGKTGSGKSTLLLNMLAQDLASGTGCALIDPHGDLFARALALVPRRRTNQVALVVPEDAARPVAFNVFRQGGRGGDPTRLASHLVTLLKSQWSEFWGPRLEHLLRNATLAVAEHPQASLLLLHQFVTSEPVRERLVARVRDPLVRAFWTQEFPGYKRALQDEMLSPVRNKLGAFVSSPAVRAVACQVGSPLHVRTLMDQGGVLLARLPSGVIGEDNARLLGGLFTVAFQLAAMERPPGARPFFLYIDEFQNFVSESQPTMLSEARKFGLGLVLAHQYLDQLPRSLKKAVLGNTGSLVLFRLGAADAEELAPEMAGAFTAHDLAWLPVHEAAVKLLVRGRALRPFSARTLPPPRAPVDAVLTGQRVTEQSRLRFGRLRGRSG